MAQGAFQGPGEEMIELLWSILVNLIFWFLQFLPSYYSKRKKEAWTKSLLSGEISTNQRKLENLRNKVNKGLQEGKEPFTETHDFERPEISVFFETKNYKSLAPFESLPRDYLEKIKQYYHKLSKLETGWNSFVEGEPLGPKIEFYPPNSSPQITKERGYALEVKAVTTIALEVGEELLFYLENQEGDEDTPRVEYIDRKGAWWKFSR